MSYVDEQFERVSISNENMKVLSQTYALTGIGILITALSVLVMTALQVPVGWPLLVAGIVLMFGLLFGAIGNANNALGLFLSLAFFAACGLLVYPAVLVAPMNVVLLALASTATVFVGASVYAYATKTDFSNIGGFLFLALISMIVISVINLFVGSPLVHLIMSWVGVLVFTGFILYDTSEIVHGREKNYISASLGMYLNILNLFMNFLSIFGADD